MHHGWEFNKLSTFPFCKCEFLFIDHESQVIAKRARTNRADPCEVVVNW